MIIIKKDKDFDNVVSFIYIFCVILIILFVIMLVIMGNLHNEIINRIEPGPMGLGGYAEDKNF
jgi:hypothetical protein